MKYKGGRVTDKDEEGRVAGLGGKSKVKRMFGIKKEEELCI